MFNYKLIKKTRITYLEQSERLLNERIKDTKISRYEDLLELEKLLITEINNVRFRLKQINKIYKNLKK